MAFLSSCRKTQCRSSNATSVLLERRKMPLERDSSTSWLVILTSWHLTEESAMARDRQIVSNDVCSRRSSSCRQRTKTSLRSESLSQLRETLWKYSEVGYPCNTIDHTITMYGQVRTESISVTETHLRRSAITILQTTPMSIQNN